MNVVIDIPDEVGQALAAQSGGTTRAVLEAVATEAYRSNIITSAQVQQMLELSSRYETELFLRRSGAFIEYTMADLQHDLEILREAGTE